MKLPRGIKLDISANNFSKVYIIDEIRNKRSKIPVVLEFIPEILEDYQNNLKELDKISLPEKFYVDVTFKYIDESDHKYILQYVIRSGFGEANISKYYCNSIEDIQKILDCKIEMDRKVGILNSGLELKE